MGCSKDARVHGRHPQRQLLFGCGPAGRRVRMGVGLAVVLVCTALLAGTAAAEAPGAPGSPPAPAGPPAPAAPASPQAAGATLQPSSARVVQVRGQVAWRQSGTEVWQRVQPGLTLSSGDELLTWDAAHVVLELAEGHRIELGPRTQLRLSELWASPGPERKGGVSRLRLWLGRVWSTVGELLGTESRYEIETDSAVAAVRGTDFFMELGEAGDVRVVVREGKVFVEAFGQTVELPPGFGLEVVPGQPPGAPQPWEYPAPPSEQPPEPEAPARPAPPAQPPAAAPTGGIPASLISDTIKGVGVVSLGLNPVLRLGPVGVSLDLRLYYSQKGDRLGLFLNRDTGEVVDPTWENMPQLLPQLFRWVEYDTPRLGVRWGRLDPVTVGEGVLVFQYSMLDHSGLRLRADFGRLGGLALVPTNDATNLTAGRVFLRPWHPVPVELGLQLAMERRAIPDRSPVGPLRGAALDAVYPLGIMLVYGQVAGIQAESPAGEPMRTGASAGLRGSLGVLSWRAEYRAGQGFPFGYFNGLYESYALSSEAARVHNLNLPAADQGISGYRLDAGLEVPLIRGLRAGIFYEQYVGQYNRLGATASVSLPNSLEAQVTYLQSPVPLDEPFRWDSPTARLITDVRYPVRPGLFVLVRRVQFFGPSGESSLQVATEFSL